MPATDPYWAPVEPSYYEAGYPVVVAPRRRSGRTVLLVFVGVLAACCAGGALLALLGSALLNGESTLGTAPPGLNTAVKDGKFEFVVTSVSCGHTSVGRNFVTKQPQGQFCIVDLSIRNIGTEGQAFADGWQKAVGPDGTTFGADTGAGVIANENANAWFTLINPGNKITGKMVFDIPTDAGIAKLELHDSPLSGGITVTVAAG